MVAIDTVVDVAANMSVVGIGVRLRMTVRALKNTVIARVGVASRAHSIGVTMTGREPRVIESGVEPSARCVTSCTTCWETGGDMVGTTGRLVLSFVTSVAVRRQSCVIVVHVTLGT